MLKKGISMLTTLLVVMVVTAAFPAQKEMRRDITLSEDVVIADQVVRKGTYILAYQPGVNGQATLMKNGQVVARVPYKVQPLERKASTSSLSYRRTGPQPVLVQVTFSGQRETLIFGDGTATQP